MFADPKVMDVLESIRAGVVCFGSLFFVMLFLISMQLLIVLSRTATPAARALPRDHDAGFGNGTECPGDSSNDDPEPDWTDPDWWKKK